MIDNHIGINTAGYFVERDRIVTKNEDRLIYWRWGTRLELLFEIREKIQII